MRRRIYAGRAAVIGAKLTGEFGTHGGPPTPRHRPGWRIKQGVSVCDIPSLFRLLESNPSEVEQTAEMFVLRTKVSQSRIETGQLGAVHIRSAAGRSASVQVREAAREAADHD